MLSTRTTVESDEGDDVLGKVDEKTKITIRALAAAFVYGVYQVPSAYTETDANDAARSAKRAEYATEAAKYAARSAKWAAQSAARYAAVAERAAEAAEEAAWRSQLAAAGL
jgi:hypothetical protein